MDSENKYVQEIRQRLSETSSQAKGEAQPQTKVPSADYTSKAVKRTEILDKMVRGPEF
jgi:hypothetical protein